MFCKRGERQVRVLGVGGQWGYVKLWGKAVEV